MVLHDVIFEISLCFSSLASWIQETLWCSHVSCDRLLREFHQNKTIFGNQNAHERQLLTRVCV